MVLAVSGGIDSMTLLDACARVSGRVAHVLVATFDHGTGRAAAEASTLVAKAAERYGVDVVRGRAEGLAGDEASWREARWRFLREVAQANGATVVTAHTRDDQVETIVMRLLRGSGGRGVSAMRAPSTVRRPLLEISRAEIESYARAVSLAWIDDPSNQHPAHLRNRVRHDLLPALRAVDPALEGDLLRLSHDAAELRQACARIVDQLVLDVRQGRVLVPDVIDASWSQGAAALFCQSVAERAGLALDWRGTSRLADFVRAGRTGRAIPLSGGWEGVRRHGALEIRRRLEETVGTIALRTDEETQFGAWRFRPGAGDEGGAGAEARGAWDAWLPAGAALEVRSWRDGDRMISSGSGQRRVKRFLSDSRVVAADRAGWPVVTADGDIVWIPGVRRALAATARPGRPRVRVVCERLYR